MNIDPEAAGFSQKLPKNLDALLKGFVDSGMTAGCAAEITRRGQTAYRRAFGFLDRESRAPMQTDSIFRIYSSTKVFTSVAMLTPFEKGAFRMYDPVWDYLPSFKHQTVSEKTSDGRERLVSVKRDVTIKDLFTMTSGLPYSGPNSHPSNNIFSAWADGADDLKGVRGWDLAKVMDEAGKYPLSFHPGEHYMYGYGSDVLGGLIEVISGMKFREYMKKAVLDPLGLNDTDFWVPAGKRSRLATLYNIGPDDALTPDRSPFFNEIVESRPVYESGGGGLVSTVGDVSRFAQMLAQSGKLGGVRILSKETVELMSSNHLNEEQLKDFNWPIHRGYGYGLGVRVLIDPALASTGASKGEFAWDGLAGTWFGVDPREELVMVYHMQINPYDPLKFIPKFMQTVYGALDD